MERIKIPEFLGESGVREYREITVTSKRQITIPKAFFDRLGTQDSFDAFLLNDGIFLKPKSHEPTVYDEDIETLVLRVYKEGYEGTDAAKEIAHRISKYNEVIRQRIEQFEAEMEGESDGGDDSFNGLEVLFDPENGEAFEENRG